MRKNCFSWMVACLFLLSGTNLWAQAYRVLDTGDPAERVCNPKSYTDLGNGIVRDNVTGLEWQQATAPGTYAWQGALDYCSNLALEGYSDWRLPSIEELSTLVDAGRIEPAIDTAYFPDTVASGYWSSTTSLWGAGYAWDVHFSPGWVDYADTSDESYVRAVRGEPLQTAHSFIDNGDGTVTDASTGLEWQQGIAPDTYSWQGALDYCAGLSLGGHSDWRLPTMNELQSIADYSRAYPAIDTAYFPDTVPSAYWSSTANAYLADYAWAVGFDFGAVSFGPEILYIQLRAVRGGSCLSSGDWCTDDNDCLDGVFCNGAETCGDNGTCFPGIPIACGDEYCNEAMDMCAACAETWQCAEGSGCVEGECVEDTPPAITAGPFLATGPWPLLATSASKAFTLNQNHNVLWTFDDDYATCEGVCTNRARYRRLDGTQWFELQAEADDTGKWYAFTELTVNTMRDGTYLFQVETVDCAGQLTTSKSYYFKVQH